MSFYNLFIGDTLDNLFSKYAWRFLFLTVGIFFLLDFILAFMKEFEDLDDFYTIDKIFLFLSFSSLDAFFDIFPLSAIVSTIICMGAISDSGELIAARVSGKKLSTIIVAVLKPVFLGMIAMLISWQFFIPNLNETANKFKFEPEKNLSDVKEQWVFKNDRFSKVTDNGSSKEVKIYDLDENGDVGSIVLSKNLEIADDEWIVKEVNDYKENISKSDFVWEDAPKLAMNFYNKSFKDMSLTENYYYWQSVNEVADRNKIGYEFWKKLLEPISLICLIIFALGISLRAIGRDKSLDRFVLGILIAFGFNLLIKIFGNISLILGWSAFWGILFSSLLLLYFGIRIIRRV
jgi:lipopolysaccharide export system permease protein|tara:strand:- start:350 stop:1390 length:1041 start_codon:yes stop_codon:yes gene_type:complete